MLHTSISKVLIVAFLFLLIFAIKLIIKIVAWSVLLDIIVNTGTSVLFQTAKVIHGTILTVTLDYFS